MVGLRVVDVGALIVWLVWFFKLREDRDDEEDDDGGGGGRRPGPDEPDRRRGGFELPRPDADPWPSRLRDHSGDRRRGAPPERRLPHPGRRREGVPGR